MNMKELRTKGRLLKPVINIGKSGITGSQIIHIKRILKKKKLIKIKFNRSALEDKDKRELLSELLEKTSAHLIDFTGFNALICDDVNPDETKQLNL